MVSEYADACIQQTSFQAVEFKLGFEGGPLFGEDGWVHESVIHGRLSVAIERGRSHHEYSVGESIL
jgi:hypothetical protein